jgi:hypothetical protein
MINLLLINLDIFLRSKKYDKTIVDKFNILFKLDCYHMHMIPNLDILLRSIYYDTTIVDKFNILLKLDYYHVPMIYKFRYFIKINLL